MQDDFSGVCKRVQFFEEMKMKKKWLGYLNYYFLRFLFCRMFYIYDDELNKVIKWQFQVGIYPNSGYDGRKFKRTKWAKIIFDYNC